MIWVYYCYIHSLHNVFVLVNFGNFHYIVENTIIETQITNISEGAYNKRTDFFNSRHTHVIAI